MKLEPVCTNVNKSSFSYQITKRTCCDFQLEKQLPTVPTSLTFRKFCVVSLLKILAVTTSPKTQGTYEHSKFLALSIRYLKIASDDAEDRIQTYIDHEFLVMQFEKNICFTTQTIRARNKKVALVTSLNMIFSLPSSSSSSYICHGIGPLVDPFRSHVSTSLFKGLLWFFCPLGRSVSLPWVIYFETFYLRVVSSFSCIPLVCPKICVIYNSFLICAFVF